MDNSITFKGAFWLKQPSQAVKKDILPTLGRHRQIFNNFTPEGDVLYITRKSADKNVANFLFHHKTKFEFYPDLSTKSGFDNEMYEEARAILKSSQVKPLTTRAELAEFFRFKLSKPEGIKKDNSYELSLVAMGFDPKSHILKKKNGYSEITDNNGKLIGKISGPGRYGISFAYLEPKNGDESPLRYAIQGKEIIFRYTSESGRVQFIKNYNNAVKANKVHSP